jgi:hypothetical protein
MAAEPGGSVIGYASMIVWLGFRSKSNVGGYGNPPYIARKGTIPAACGVDGLTECHGLLLVASGGPWNCYDFPGCFGI